MKNHLEVHNMLALSTAHLLPSTMQKMHDKQLDEVIYYHKDKVGFFIPIIEDGEMAPTNDLREVISFARENEFTWIMVDCDAPIVKGLPTYNVTYNPVVLTVAETLKAPRKEMSYFEQLFVKQEMESVLNYMDEPKFSEDVYYANQVLRTTSPFLFHLPDHVNLSDYSSWEIHGVYTHGKELIVILASPDDEEVTKPVHVRLQKF